MCNVSFLSPLEVLLMRLLFFLALGCVVCATSLAQPTLDGSISGDAYNLRTTQTVETQFGDNQSELNAAYTRVDGGVLYLALTGNLENNFNKLNIFIDSVAGGQNVLQADANNGGNNPENDNWANQYNGFTFDTGFEADYMLIARNGASKFDLDFATIGGGLGAFEAASDVFGGAEQGANANALATSGIGVAFDNSNTAGVLGGTGAADMAAAQAVQTGLELAIPLTAIGNPNLAELKISAMINGSSHDFLSNQFLAGLDSGTGNLGGPLSGVNMNQLPGNQFISAVPEPSSVALVLLASAAGMIGLRRKP